MFLLFEEQNYDLVGNQEKQVSSEKCCKCQRQYQIGRLHTAGEVTEDNEKSLSSG